MYSTVRIEELLREAKERNDKAIRAICENDCGMTLALLQDLRDTIERLELVFNG